MGVELVYVLREYVQPWGLGIKPWDEIKQGLKVMSISYSVRTRNIRFKEKRRHCSSLGFMRFGVVLYWSLMSGFIISFGGLAWELLGMGLLKRWKMHEGAAKYSSLSSVKTWV